MVSVQLRNRGQGLWRSFTLPTTVQAAQTLASAAKTMNLADSIRIQPAVGAEPKGRIVDLKV